MRSLTAFERELEDLAGIRPLPPVGDRLAIAEAQAPSSGQPEDPWHTDAVVDPWSKALASPSLDVMVFVRSELAADPMEYDTSFSAECSSTTSFDELEAQILETIEAQSSATRLQIMISNGDTLIIADPPSGGSLVSGFFDPDHMAVLVSMLGEPEQGNPASQSQKALASTSEASPG